ncbi:MAG: isoleucyl-tRNA synthetase [Actinomycetota bacterium]|jgi:isoleucyl-tRNA synthetase|nr:isoleucyl-tRNA synthetase [Actinomycetota bacterium]
MARFEPVDPKVRFPELEARILTFWNAEHIFEASLAQREGSPEWVFYDGPPTANAKPHIGHAVTRTFKDIYPRFKTMTGHYVFRKAGWDCHGLPVEIEVEKEIGTKGKRDIEAFGVAAFNERCRESVRRYVRDWEALTERIGFWLDMSDPYWTMDTEYMESVWWSLKSLHGRGLLQEADKVTAYCPRCGTALSDAEVAQGYETVEDPSVFVRFPLISVPGDPDLVGAGLLVWTTTPWTLPSNTGAAVDRAADYDLVERNGERLIIASSLRAQVLEDAEFIRTFRGETLIGARFTPPYPNVDNAHTVVHGDFVTMEDGTGIVHMAPAFGAPDLAVGLEQGWPVHKPVGDDGRFTDLAPEFIRGLFFKDADPVIMEDLRSRGLLLREGVYEHSYPFCWRCSTPLLYYARTSWYVRTTEVKDRLLAVNDTVDWHPEHLKTGRFGNWLENNVDWALSRERYWGTPLPIWRCTAGHQTAIGSLSELGQKAGRDLSGLDPHRPYIDEVTFACPECDAVATRVPEVIDTWYDSGAMPYAQWGYHPELGRGLETFAKRYPADFISEAIDQTRGWFYTLMAEGTLHFDETAYRSVVCFGHITDEDGRKMSKSLGNVMDPMAVMESHGADALRWLLLTSGSPWSSRRVSPAILDEVVRQFLLTLWNVYSFFITYANVEGFDPDVAPPPVADRPLLDRWVLSRLAATCDGARSGLDDYDATGAGRRIAAFIDDLSNWYVRRSRRRFWDPEGDARTDSTAAFHTLYECLTTIALLLAPFTPFITEELWLNLAAWRSSLPRSVHLADYPAPDAFPRDPALEEAMDTARAIVELGRRVRTDTKTRTRQPLSEAVIHLPGDPATLRHLLPIVAEELNVREVVFAESVAGFGRWHAKPNFKTLGPKLGPRVKELAGQLRSDDGTLAGRLAHGEAVELTISGVIVVIEPVDVDLAQEVREGWGVASESGITVALDLELADDLRTEGLARELVRTVQDARKAAGFEVSDRIALGVEGDDAVIAALRAHADYIAGETLATDLQHSRLADVTFERSVTLEGAEVKLTLRRLTPGA